jgi:pyruvate dehydrogenase (quinone)
VRLMQEVALHNVQVTGPEPPNCACRAALGGRGVAHLMIAKDVQMMKRSADKRPMRNQGARTSSSWIAAPRPAAQLKAAVDG